MANIFKLEEAAALLLTVFMLIIAPSGAVAATLPGTNITNTAEARYSVSGLPAAPVPSNTVTATSVAFNTPAKIEFMKYAPGFSGAEMDAIQKTSFLTSGGMVKSVPLPRQPGSSLLVDVTVPVPLVDADFYQETESAFIKLTDHDYDGQGSVDVTVTVDNVLGEVEILRLKESGTPGVFIGYIRLTTAAPTVKNGLLSIMGRSVITVNYVDKADGSDTAAAAALVDPYGLVFDTSTGASLDGASVTLLDAATGLPALVHGDNGTSIYPSTVTTGGTAKDSAGKKYTFAKGEYRFPFVSAGLYRLSVVPPNGYRTPSQVTTAFIQTLPGAPFAIVNPGSRNEDFVVNPGPALHIDIPVDPVVRLYLVKSVSKTIVSPGDFLQYKLMLEDTAGGPLLTGVVVKDKLPLGFRYRKGSARLDGVKVGDPVISADGRGLAFSVTNLVVNGRIAITYVVEVGAVARTGKAENTAQARADGGHLSNVARAVVTVKEDLFMSKTIIVGRVAADNCGDNEGESLEGVRIYLEDGSYVITDKNGEYHFEGVTPGTHVVQLDLASAPKGYRITACEENTRFAGATHSQFVDLQPGTMWRADFTFTKRPAQLAGTLPQETDALTEMQITPQAELSAESQGDVKIELKGALRDAPARKDVKPSEKAKPGIADYSVAIQVSKVPLKNLRLTVLLPDGARYIEGTSRLGDSDLEEPVVTGNVLTYRLGDAPEGWDGLVKFIALVTADGDAGELATKAILLFDTADAKNRKTPLTETTLIRVLIELGRTRADITLRPHFEECSAAINAEDRETLDALIKEMRKAQVERITVVGHTDSNAIRERSRRHFADNNVLSKARAASIAQYIASALRLDASQVIIDGKGFDVPVASNETEEGRAMNRRVELSILAERVITWPELKNGRIASGIEQTPVVVTASAQVAGDAVNVAGGGGTPEIAGYTPAAGEKEPAVQVVADYDMTWLEGAEPGLELLWPYEGFNPPIPAVKVVIKHDPAAKLVLLLNGTEVSGFHFDNKIKRKDGLAALSLWRGVHLIDGDNLFEAVEYKDGVETGRLVRVIHYSGAPVKAEFLPKASMLAADGKNPPTLAFRLTDKDGKPVREGVIGEFTVNPPYLPQKKVDELAASPLIESKSDRVQYIVGPDGLALIRLQPTTQTGEAVVKVVLAGGEEEFRVWLTPELRDWILVGLAEGTAGYDAVSGNMESLGASGASEDLYKDGRTAFFAKGRVKGEWLLTVAYDTDKNGRAKEENKSLYQTIDPGTYYTIYGDASSQQYDAASARALYVKIERDRFYALFGDYDTGLSVTELSRYSRNFNGLKSEYKGEQADWDIFFSDTNQAYVKDELRPDGTSGLYKLSRRNIVMNSETITLETRNRFHSEQVVASQTLSRHIDYDIDYDAGTLDFRTPVYGRDENLNPVYIVVAYESNDATADLAYNYGGRGAVRLAGGKVETGATDVHEGGVGGHGDLMGVDATVKLDEQTKIKTEYAETIVDRYNHSTEGNAYLAELTHKTDKADGKAYVRQQSQEFGLGTQRGGESGTRKYGLDGAYALNPQTSVVGELYRQDNVTTGASRSVAETQTRYGFGPFDVHLGLRHAADTFTDGQAKISEQLLAGARYRLLDDKLILRLDRDQSIGGNNRSGDFPTRTIGGLDYKLGSTATLVLEHEITSGQYESSKTTRLGLRAAPWSGAQMSSSVGQEQTEAGVRVFSSSGLKQTWQVTEKFSVDAGVDKTVTHKHPGNTSVNGNVPEASGGEKDYTAFSLGSGYREKKWSLTGRVEARDAKGEDKKGLALAANGEPTEGLGLLAGVRFNRSSQLTGEKTKDADARLGAAWRPKKTRLIVLDRLDLMASNHTGGEFAFHNRKIVNNLNANYKLEARTQISLQYGAKYVKEAIDGAVYSGYIDLTGIEGRYDVTKNWDVGLRVAALHSWRTGQYNYGSGASVGYNFAKNIWISVGYNFTGFKDRDFSKADFTAKGPFIKFRMKFDQETAREAVKWFGGQ